MPEPSKIEDVILDIEPIKVESKPAEDVIKDEPIKIPKDTYKTIYCRVCGRGFKAITAQHTNTHNLSLAQYIEKFPDAPINFFGRLHPKASEVPKGPKEKIPEKFKNITKASDVLRDGTYFDKQGCLRDSKTKRLMKGTKPLNPKGREKMTPVENFIRNQIGWTGEEVFKFLYGIVKYNHTKQRHKTPWYTVNQQIQASKLLLEYAFGKPTTFQKVEKTVNKLSLKIGLRLPDDFDPEDF